METRFVRYIRGRFRAAMEPIPIDRAEASGDGRLARWWRRA